MPKCRVVEEGKSEVINMNEMRPLQIGRVVGSDWDGHLVWRTAAEHRAEVVDFSNYKPGYSWTSFLPDMIKVRLLAPGEEVRLVLSND